MTRNNKRVVDARRWPGVLSYQSGRRKHNGKPDVCYYIRYHLPDGKKRVEKVGWKSEAYTPQIAAEIRSERIRSARHGEDVKTSKEIARERRQKNRTLDEIKDAYFESRGKGLKGRMTDINRYENHIKPLLGRKAVGSLSPLDIDRLRLNMKEHRPATVSNTLELVRRLVNFGAEKKLCPQPSFKIKVPRKDNRVTEYLEPEELGRLLEVLDSWPSEDVSRMLKIAILSGLRRGEIFRLQTKDVDFTHRFIKLHNPKGGRSVSIPLSEAVLELLQEQLKWKARVYSTSPYVFPGKNGGQRVFCSAAKRIKKEAGLPRNFRIFHGLRHNYAVTLANSGQFSLDMIGELLTHKSREMTKRYAQFLPDTMKRASNRAAELILNQISQQDLKANKRNLTS